MTECKDTEKMDLPTKEIMMERAMAKTGYQNDEMLDVLARVIILLDKTARANAIKGVAGMRSYFYWWMPLHKVLLRGNPFIIK